MSDNKPTKTQNGSNKTKTCNPSGTHSHTHTEGANNNNNKVERKRWQKLDDIIFAGWTFKYHGDKILSPLTSTILKIPKNSTC